MKITASAECTDILCSCGVMAVKVEVLSATDIESGNDRSVIAEAVLSFRARSKNKEIHFDKRG